MVLKLSQLFSSLPDPENMQTTLRQGGGMFSLLGVVCISFPRPSTILRHRAVKVQNSIAVIARNVHMSDA